MKASTGSGRRAALAALIGSLALVVWSTVSAPSKWATKAQGDMLRQLSPSSPTSMAQAGCQVHSPAASISAPVTVPSTVGPRLQPWVDNRSCLVYIMDASAELAPLADVPQCDIHDTSVSSL